MPTETAADRIRAALDGKPDAALVKVSAADVAEAGRGLADHTPETAGLLAGALKVVAERWGLPRDDRRLQVYQTAGHLRLLLDRAAKPAGA